MILRPHRLAYVPTTLYSADVVCPMAGPPLADAGVLVENARVVAVGATAGLAANADRRHHVDGALLPGLVNGHTHLELADASALALPGPFPAWARALDGMTGAWAEDRWARSAHRGVLQALRCGTTAVFDTVARGPAVPAAARAGLAGNSYVEIVDVDVEHADSVLGRVEHALGLPADGRTVGVAPHSAVRLGTGVLQSLAALAKRCSAPLQVHCAQSDDEVTALRQGIGALADQARAGGYEFEWLAGGAPTPVRYLEALGVLIPGASLVHGVRLDAGEMRLLSRLALPVVCCPRANARLQMGPAPLELYAENATPLALGTESLAASPDLDVLAEAAAWVQLAESRGLHIWPSRIGPLPLPEAAVRLATVDGAAALGWGDRCGTLETGRRADLVGIALETSPATVFRDLVERGTGRQVLTVLAGVRKARRDGPTDPWPEIDDDSWRA